MPFKSSYADAYDNLYKDKDYAQEVNLILDYINKSDIPVNSIVDIGCGTGLSGFALKKNGFKSIDGLDLSEEMLKIAEKKKIYQSLFNFDLNNLTDFNNKYDAIIAAGVISPKHANPDTILSSYPILKKKGLMIFSINDHALNDSLFFSSINKIIQNSNFILLDQIYGDHIKELNLKSSIFVLQKSC